MIRDGWIISDLTDYYDFRRLDKSNPRPGGSDCVLKITPHHMAGDLSRGQMEAIVAGPREMSCNYAIYSDGVIEAFIPEALRSWCSSSYDNDAVSITIEVANCGGAPDWPVSDLAYEALVALCADICSRYGISPHFNGGPSGTITEHKMFAATACPGPYLSGIIESGKLERDIIDSMSGDDTEPEPEPEPETLYIVQAGAFGSKDNATSYSERLKKAGFDNFVKLEGKRYIVQAGAFADRTRAVNVSNRLNAAGYPAFVKKRGN